MSSSLLPFLYQTKTILRSSWRPLTSSRIFTSAGQVAVRHMHAPGIRNSRHKSSEFSIPFEFDADQKSRSAEDGEDGTPSTITPAEAEIFKNIFDEIAQGKMPKAKPANRKWPGAALSGASGSGSLWEMPNPNARADTHQDRIYAFREKFLQRYPPALRESAQLALGFHEFAPNEEGGDREFYELSLEERQKQAAEKAKYEAMREEQRQRVESLMERATTDEKLWAIVQHEVFSLPDKLGISEEKPNKAKAHQRNKKKGKEADDHDSKLVRKEGGISSSAEDAFPTEEQQLAMNVSGPLYPHYLNKALSLFDSGFSQPSPYSFQILPTLKSLGLQAYILGVSTPLYLQLAKIHWNRYGDAASALDMLQEMNSMGFYADEEVVEFLRSLKVHFHGLTWGSQGPFAMAVMESPHFDDALRKRLEGMLRWATGSSSTRAKEVSVDKEV